MAASQSWEAEDMSLMSWCAQTSEFIEVPLNRRTMFVRTANLSDAIGRLIFLVPAGS